MDSSWMSLPWNGIGVVGLVVIVLFANVKGWIEFRTSTEKRNSMYEAMLQDKDRQIEGKNREIEVWRKTADDWQAAFGSRDSNVKELIASAEATAKLLETLRQEVEHTRRGPTGMGP